MRTRSILPGILAIMAWGCASDTAATGVVSAPAAPAAPAALDVTVAVADDYDMTDLGGFGGTGGRVNSAVAINDSGQIVGYSSPPGSTGYDSRAFLWKNGVMISLPALGADPDTRAYDISPAGHVIGTSHRSGPEAVLWFQGQAVDLARAYPGVFVVNAVNADGAIAAECTGALQRHFACVLQAGTITRFDTVGFSRSSARSLNGAGTVVGTRTEGARPFRTIATRWINGIGTALVTPVPTTYSDAAAINARGDIAGSTLVPFGAAHVQHAMLWLAGHPIDLGVNGRWQSWATDINDRGAVVGVLRLGDGRLRPFLWRNGHMIELPTTRAAVHDAAAFGINNLGEIVGQLTLRSGETRAVVWRKR